MKNRIGVVFLLLGICFLNTSFVREKAQPAYTIQTLLDDVFKAIDNIKTMRYELKCNERIKGRMQHTESNVKLQVSPRKLYLSVRGPEVLWIEGVNNGNALVNPGSFPYINLNLDPYGSLMRKDQHHTIHEMGHQYLADILKDGIKRAGNDMEKYFTLLGEEKHNGRDCYKVSISFPDFSWVSYTVKPGENLTSIARKLNVSEYMVLEKNSRYSWYNDAKAGDVIKVPDAYAKFTLLLIDK